MNTSKKKSKVTSSDLRSRLEEYSTLKEKARWPQAGETETKDVPAYLDRFPFSVFREMHRFLLFKATLILFVILVAFLLSLINIPLFAALLHNIYFVTNWQMDLAQTGREIMPVLQQFWEGDPEVGLNSPVIAPAEKPGPEEGVDPTPGKDEPFQLPVEGILEIPFGLTSDGSMNYGLVFQVLPGSEVSASLSGRVKERGCQEEAGYYLVLEHVGGLETIYGYLAELEVEEMQEIAAGQVIGKIDQAGMNNAQAWFYFELRQDGRPKDPAPLFRDEKTVDNE